MAAAQVVASICEGLREEVFEIRRAIPLTWRGAAAERFEAQVEEAIVGLVRATELLSTSAGLILMHEERMRLLGQSMAAGG